VTGSRPARSRPGRRPPGRPTVVRNGAPLDSGLPPRFALFRRHPGPGLDRLHPYVPRPAGRAVGRRPRLPSPDLRPAGIQFDLPYLPLPL
jgi:hypothetical protein